MPDHDAEARAAAYWHSMLPAQKTAQGTLFPTATVAASPIQHPAASHGAENVNIDTTPRLRPLAI